MRLTKEVQKQMIADIKEFFDKNKITDWCYLWNGYMYSSNGKGEWIQRKAEPSEYCEYFPEDFVLGFIFDGDAYEIMNGYCQSNIPDAFSELLGKYNCWMEYASEAYCYLVSENEFTEYYHNKKESICWLYHPDQAPDATIRHIMTTWYSLSEKVGDFGGCVVGAYLEFVYNGQKYRMSAQSPWQGEGSWTTPLDTVIRMTRESGATDIRWNCGRLD